MSKYLSIKYKNLKPYVPGEQPQNMEYNKLNTNESPFPPSPLAQRMAREAAGDLQLYSDPDCRQLCSVASDYWGIEKDQVLFFNGSDETINYACMAFCDKIHPMVFPDITYGFYEVVAGVNSVPFKKIPLKEDFTIDPEDYIGLNTPIFIANPNAPTGISLPLKDIERIIAGNPDSAVIIDEAYVDFGGESALPLINKYDNLLVIQTFSKSRSLAGGRLGLAFGSREITADINAIKFSVSPYAINRMTMGAAIGAITDDEYFKANCQKIIKTRESSVKRLRELGFEVLPSSANFVFARNPKMGGRELYEGLKERGVLVRYFDKDRLRDFLRISIGSEAQMEDLFAKLKELLGE